MKRVWVSGLGLKGFRVRKRCLRWSLQRKCKNIALPDPAAAKKKEHRSSAAKPGLHSKKHLQQP